MKRLTQEEITDIREKVNIVDVISNYIPLEKAGSNFKGICPFHDDHDPSMSVNVDKQIFKCFVCGEGGNVFNFIQKYEQVSFIESVKKVGELIGFDFSDYSIGTYKPKIDQQIARYYRLMDEAQRYLEYTLNNNKEDFIAQFLKDRQLNDDIIDEFKLGYADPKFPLAQYLLKKGYQLEELEAINLAKEHESGISEVFNHRIVFPITNDKDQIVAYTARALDEHGPKYINSSTNPIYQKSNVLYNYPKTQAPLLKDKPLIIVEGVMDVIAFYRAGLQKVVAVLGTALSEVQINLIKRLNSSVILAFDGDEAGQAAMINIGAQLRENHINVSIMNNNTNLDPDDILNQYSKETLIEMINKPMHWMEFVIKFASQRYTLTSYNARKRVLEFSVAQLILEDKLDQNYFVQQIAEVTQFNKEMVLQQLNQIKKPEPVKRPRESHQPFSTQHILKSEKDVLAHILDGKNFAQEFKLNLGYLIDPQANDLALLMTNLYNSRDTIGVADCLDLNLSQIQQVLLLEISEESLYQYPKSSIQLQEAISSVKLADIDNLLRINDQSILETSDINRKLELLQEKTNLLQQRDKLLQGG